MLQSRQIVARSRLVDERTIPRIDKTNGIAEFVSRICSRNLSIFDHSWTERLRNATTTPANPARATATCALALKASFGCILHEIRFDPFGDEIGINIKTVAHGSAAVQDLRLGSVTEEETEVAGHDFVNVAEPGATFVLRHEVQFDEQEFCLRQNLLRADEHVFFVTLDVNFQQRNLAKIGK